MSYLVRGGRLIDPGSGLDALGDLLIIDDRIGAMGQVEAAGDVKTIDATGLVVCPGLIDMHVHLREPGFETKETIATGTAAAGAGGFSTLCAEPNTRPPVDSRQRVSDALARARQTAHVRVHPKACLTIGQQGEAASDAKALKAAGAIALSDDGEPVLHDEVMRDCLRGAAEAGLLVTTHCEESPRSRTIKPWAMPFAAEADLVRRDIGLLAALPARLHFSHLSMADSLEALAEARSRGLNATAEVTPHHCLLSDEDVPKGDANFKVNPPLRPRGDVEALAKGMINGTIEVIASDHAPHTPEEKAQGWEQAPFGVIGLETTLPVMLTKFVHTGRMEVAQLLAKMTYNPARILGLQSGRLSIGAPADVALLDLDAEWVVDPRQFKSRGRNCPFAGWRVKGQAVGLLVAGRTVMRDGELLSAAAKGAT